MATGTRTITTQVLIKLRLITTEDMDKFRDIILIGERMS